MKTTIELEDIWGPDDGPETTEGPPLAVWCPACSAYLMTLGLEPDKCDQCGYEFQQQRTTT